MTDRESMCPFTVTLSCPLCKRAVSKIEEGCCDLCRYVLLGGDLAPDDLLLHPSWTAVLS